MTEHFWCNMVQAEVQQSPLRIAATVALYLVIFYSKCITMVPRCTLAAALAVFLHAALRRARSEYGSIDRADLNAQAANHQIDVLQLESQRLRKSMRPGVLFSEMLSLHTPGTAGSTQGVRVAPREVEDPGRVFREVWGQGKQVGGFAAGCCVRLLRYYWYEARERVRTWRLPLHV